MVVSGCFRLYLFLTLFLVSLLLSGFLTCWEVLRCVCVVWSFVTDCFVLWSTLLCLFSVSTRFSLFQFAVAGGCRLYFVSIVSSSFRLCHVVSHLRVVTKCFTSSSSCQVCSFRSSLMISFFKLFSLFRILVGCLDWFSLFLLVVQWIRLCFAVFCWFSLIFNLFQVVLSSSSWVECFRWFSFFKVISVCFSLFQFVLCCEKLVWEVLWRWCSFNKFRLLHVVSSRFSFSVFLKVVFVV